MKFVMNDYEPKEIMKIIREWSEMTQEQFGKTLNKNRKTIQHYELGDRNYNIVTLLEIAKKHNLIITVEKKK